MEHKIILGENPIIFPNLTYRLAQHGVRINIIGKKRADFKLAFNLLEGACNCHLPDVSVFNVKTGEWEHYYDREILEIVPPVGSPYCYMKPSDDAFQNYSILENFIRLYSSATITMKQLEK